MVKETVNNVKLVISYGSKKGSCTFGDMRTTATAKNLYDTAVAINSFQVDPWDEVLKKVTSELSEI